MGIRGILKRQHFIGIAFLSLLISGWLQPCQSLGWETVSPGDIEVSQSRAQYNRVTKSYVSTVTAVNISESDIAGEFRLIVESSTKNVHNPDGTTSGGEPFFNLVTGEEAVFSASETFSLGLVFDGGRGRLIYTVRLEYNPSIVSRPEIQVTPATLNLGEVLVGSSTTGELIINETGGASLDITGVQTDNSVFTLFPPTIFSIDDGGAARQVSIGCAPFTEGIHSGNITILNNAGPPMIIPVTCSAVAPVTPGDISGPDSIEFGAVEEENTVTKTVTVSNSAPLGAGSIVVNSASIDHTDFSLPGPPANNLPFTLDPGESRNVYLNFTPASGSGGTTVEGNLTLASDDPDEPALNVRLAGDAVEPFVPPPNNPVLSAVADGPVTAGNCGSIDVQVLFGTDASSSDSYEILLLDQQGNSVVSSQTPPPQGGGTSTLSIDTCGLADGFIDVLVSYVKNGDSLPDFKGTPTTKNTSVFPAPVLDPLAPVSVFGTIQVCGTSRENTTVVIDGGAIPVSVTLDESTTTFCVDVTLRRNTQNTLVATAFDDQAPAPRPTASAEPVQVVHIDPSEIVIAEASSRPLTVEEIETLVANNVIQLDDPSNFNVSMFTIVLTIGQFPVTISQPVPVDSTPGTVSYGCSGGGWYSGSGGGTGGIGGGGGSSSQVVVITPPQGPAIPGVILIDGRIKTLKEFFQVTIAIQNTSDNFAFKDVAADITLPSGLTPLKAGPGTDVSTINTGSAIDHIDLGEIAPLSTGTGQFIIRGDGIGTHNVGVNFSGFIVGGGLPDPYAFDGTVGTTVQVFGPPELDVVVRHPSHAGTHDVVAGEIYTLTVELTNRSPVPALYTSLELMVGGNAELVDADGIPVPDSIEVRDFGHIQPGQTVSAAFLVKASVQGEIIACQAVTSENINLSVDTGPDGTSCNIANSIPVNFEFPEGSAPPTLMAINPLNGQYDIPVTTSVLATLTPPTACLTADTWENITTDYIDPNDHSKGLYIVSADLVTTGTFNLEELDPLGNPVRHIPVHLYLETGVGGDTTTAVLRLGLESPLSQYFLRDNTTYRATLVGGLNGICNESSNIKMENNYSWTFSTQQTCDVTASPVASLANPIDGSDERPLNQVIVIDFTNRMNPGSFAFIPGNFSTSTFGVYQNPTLNGAGNELLTEGSLVPGSGVFRNLNRTLIYTPTIALSENSDIYIRLTNGLSDVCGNPLATGSNGVRLFTFKTILPDITAPAAPVVNPISSLTNASSVQVTGSAEADATIHITGGSSPISQAVSGSGLFTASVPLNSDQAYTFQVKAEDSSGNLSPVTTLDTNGDSLSITRDTSSPSVALSSPADGGVDIPLDAVILVRFSEPVKEETINSLNFILEGSVVDGSFALEGTNGFTFTPDQPLEFGHTYTGKIRANGIRDLAGNGLTADFSFTFTTESAPAPILTGITPASGVQGTSFSVTFTGPSDANLAAVTGVISGNPDISGTLDSVSDSSVTATVQIGSLAATGSTTLGLTSAFGDASLPFIVVQKPPVIDSLTPSSVTQGQTVDVTVQGSGLTGANFGISGTGATLSNLGGGSDTRQNLRFDIAVGADATVRTVTATTPGGSDTATFTVVPLPPPDVTAIVPAGGIPGALVDAQLFGSGLRHITGISIDGQYVSVSLVPGSAVEVVPQSYSFDQGTDCGTYCYHDWSGAQLIDGQYGIMPWHANLGNGNAYEWVGWVHSPVVNIDFDFGSATQVDEIRIGTTQDYPGDVVLPNAYVYSSPNGSTWTPIGSLLVPESTANNDTYRTYAIGGLSANARYYRVSAHFSGNGPWTFIDEVDFYQGGAAAVDNVRDVQFDINVLASPGPRNVTVTTPAGFDTETFTVVEPPTPAVVDPVPTLTNAGAVVVSGTADPNATIRILGGSAVATGGADGTGAFSVTTNLIPNTANSLQVFAGDAYGNEVETTLDNNGDPLTVVQDSTAPQVTLVDPADGETDVALDATVQVDFSEALDPATVISETTFLLEGSVIPGAIVVAPDGMSLEFTPDADLIPAKTYTVRIPTGGITDLAGNGFSGEFTSTFTTVTTTPVDLRVGWAPQGAVGSGAGIWNVSADGTTVTQTQNGNPTFFVSPEAVINRTLTGTFRTTDSDDDWMGFVFGYQAPFSGHGDAANDYEFFLLDWKQKFQNPHPEGFTLSRVTGTGISRHQEEPGQTIIANDLGSTRGWVRNRNYEFRLEYASDAIRIWIIDPLDTRFDEPAEQLIFDVTPEDVFGAGTDRGFVNGRFGFFNQSQRYVTYSGFVQEFQAPPPAPTLTQAQPLGLIAGTSGMVTLFGSDLETAFEVRSTNPDVQARIVGVAADGSDVQVELTVGAGSVLGSTTLEVETFGGTALTSFIIDVPPSLSELDPPDVFEGETVDVTFTGTGLSSAIEVISTNPGIVGTITSATDASVVAQVTILPAATIGSTDLGLRTAVGEASLPFIVNLSGVSVRVAQESGVGVGDFESNVLGFLQPIETADTAVAYFSYGNPERASYNGVFPLPTAEVTSLFFVDAADGLHLFMVHDIANDSTGGSFSAEFDLDGASGAGIVLEDDPGETTDLGSGVFRGNHSWSSCCTDGMVIGPLPGEGWSMTGEALSVPSGINDWKGVSGNGSELNLDFEVGRRIRFDMLVGP